MSNKWLERYLGEFATTVTGDQRETMLEINGIADQVFSDPDQQDERQEMFSTAVQVIMGDTDVETVIADWKTAMTALTTATARMRGAVAVAVEESNESVVADKYGINRATVRKAVGK